MDDFSLTNSNRELSARGNSGDESGSSRVSRLSPSRSSFRGAARSGTLINYHRRLKLYCRRSLASHPEGRTVNVERTKIENFQVRRSFVRPSVRSFVSPRFGLQRVILATLCTYRPVRGLCVCAHLGVPISKIATFANEVTLYNRDAPSMVLNEIG